MRLSRFAAELCDFEGFAPELVNEITAFHFSTEGLNRIADALPEGELKDEGHELARLCDWLHETIEDARKARGASTEAA